MLDHLMKVECFIANATAAGSPISAEHEVSWTIFDFFGRFGPL